MAQAVTSLLSQMPESVHVGFVLDAVAQGQGFLRVLRFSCQYHSTMAAHTHMGLNKRPVGGYSSEN
jgi:hypothetical protein